MKTTSAISLSLGFAAALAMSFQMRLFSPMTSVSLSSGSDSASSRARLLAPERASASAMTWIFPVDGPSGLSGSASARSYAVKFSPSASARRAAERGMLAFAVDFME